MELLPNKPSISLEVKNISKNYKNLKALDKVSAKFSQGKVTTIYGPNGAGKSTLVKAICGVESRDSGSVFLHNKEVNFGSYKDALKNGISYVPQDFGLIDNLTAIENLSFLFARGVFIYNEDEIKKHIDSRHNLLIPFKNYAINVRELSEYGKQVLAINKALLSDSDVFIFDETTTNFSEQEFSSFKNILQHLKNKHKIIIFISHKLNEVYEVSDEILVLKNGIVELQDRVELINKESIINLFITEKGQSTTSSKLTKIPLCNLSICTGEEIKNIVILRGQIIAIESRDPALKQRVAYSSYETLKKNKGVKVGLIPANREEEGIFKNLSVLDNLTLNIIKQHGVRGMISELKSANAIAKQLELKFQNWEQNIDELSGGNKQKVVFGRWLLSGFDIMILIEPTSGIDLKTKQIIHELIWELCDNGKAFLLFTSDEGEKKALAAKTISVG